ncbi:MAG: DNA repair protein RadA [Chitinispirillaceae bacterium]
MNKKLKTAYVCNSCGQDYSKWRGKCDACGTWDSITEFRIAKGSSKASEIRKETKPVPLCSCKSQETERICSSFTEVDRVLGGGLVGGAFLLLGGDPGIGKSTLLLQLMAQWADDRSVLYVSGEESAEQVSIRARRLGVGSAPVEVLTETSMETLLSVLSVHKPKIVVVDSIQTMFTETLESAPGSVSQIRECGSMLLRHAKTEDVSVILIGHVTKEGTIAGPRVLEHMVDTVLQFEGDGRHNYRILRSVKNRFGPGGEIALFTMTDAGLAQTSNASEFFLLNRDQPQVGTSIAPILEGSRVLVVELQALVNQSHFGLPQRVASGINPRKLSLLIAVLEKYGGISLGDHDVFFNIAGGLTVSEPAADLAIIAALLSSFRSKPLKKDLAFIGELGLGGEIRPVNNMTSRLKELAGMGFRECVMSKPPRSADWEKMDSDIALRPCSRVGDMQDVLF